MVEQRRRREQEVARLAAAQERDGSLETRREQARLDRQREAKER